MATQRICAEVDLDKAKGVPVFDFDLAERMFEVPTYAIRIAAENTPLRDYLGQEAVIRPVEPTSGLGPAPRVFAGIVTEAESQTGSGGVPQILLTIRPALAVLGLSQSSAIYLNKTSVDIFQEVLKRNGLDRLKVVASKISAKREICIQYNENDLDFVRRLLAEDGVTMYCNDGEAATAVILHDVSKPFPASKDAEAKTKLALTDAATPDAKRERVDDLTLAMLATSGKVSLTSYDPDSAKVSTKGNPAATKVTMKAAPAFAEYRAAPNGTVQGPPLTVSTGQTDAGHSRLRGVVRNGQMYLGRAIDVASDRSAYAAGDYVLTAITYRPGTGEGHVCEFEAVPTRVPPYPERLPKPLIHSVHNAVVTGTAGEPACDAEGRVKVKFFWDGSDEKKNTSCPVRVAETYAGAGYGAKFIPRAGQEVLVSFLHGDPDAPVITGQIHNGQQKHPFVSANTTKSGITTKLKGKSNELEFDDKSGSELLALRAAKDYNLEVTEASTRDVKKTEDTTIGEGATLDVGKNYKVTVKDKTDMSSATMAVAVEKSSTHEAQTVEITGKNKITLKVGGSKIELTPAGITISATQVKVAAKSALKLEGLTVDAKAKTGMNVKGLQVAINGSVKTEVKGGAMAELKGGGMLKLQGGVAMIN